MPCESFENQMLDYLENQLAAPDRARVEKHLAGCAACRALAQQLQQLDLQLTRSVKSPALSPAFSTKLQQRIQATPIMSSAEIAERKRRLQAEYEAGLQRLSPLPQLPRRLFETLGLAAMIALAGWLVWLLLPPATIEAAGAGLSVTGRRLMLLSVAGAVPIVIGFMLAVATRRNQPLLWQPAGNFSAALVG
jgi:anti-sigma factor RsiW